jgi:poly [ADP-ribose] polymerase
LHCRALYECAHCCVVRVIALEVALGKEHSITRDDSSLKVAPKGFDSIVARGVVEPSVATREPNSSDSTLQWSPHVDDCCLMLCVLWPALSDPKKDTTLRIDGNDVRVPQSAPIPQPQYVGSSFSQSEYLIYKESQHRIRYMIRFDGW